VETNESAPYPVTFSFISKNVQPVYLLRQCRTQFAVKSCFDGYQSSLAISADCTVDCNDPPVGACMACDCAFDMVPVSDSSSLEVSWPGNTYTFAKNADGCECHNRFEAPAGKYRIEVPVYLTNELYPSTPDYTAVVDFTLPAPSGVVTVDLTEAYPED
jgi:hypothetical protein